MTTYIEYLAFECHSLDVKLRKYEKAEAKVGHQQDRVDWVRSEIDKIKAEQKAAGESGGSSFVRSRKRKPTEDADGVDGIRKCRRTDEADGKLADNSRTTPSKKRKFPEDEDAAEPKLKIEEKVACESDGLGTRRRKRCKGTH